MSDQNTNGSDMEENSEEEETLYEVERVIGKTKMKGEVMYKVRWKGYGPDDDTWEPVDNLTSCKELIEEFEKKQQEAAIKRTEERKKRKALMEGKTATVREEVKTESTGYTENSAYPPNFKNTFWKELEAGRINVFDNDMYSKVKSRVCKSTSPNYTPAVPLSSDKKDKKKKEKRKSKSDQGTDHKNSRKSSKKGQSSSKHKNKYKSTNKEESSFVKKDTKKRNYIVESDSDTSLEENSRGSRNSCKDLDDSPCSGSTVDYSQLHDEQSLGPSSPCSCDNMESDSDSCCSGSCGYRRSPVAERHESLCIETNPQKIKIKEEIESLNQFSPKQKDHHSSHRHGENDSSDRESVKKRKRETPSHITSLSETFNKSKQPKHDPETDISKSSERKDKLCRKFEKLDNSNKTSPIIPVIQTTTVKMSVDSGKNVSEEKSKEKTYSASVKCSPGVEGYLHRASSGQIIVSKLPSSRLLKEKETEKSTKTQSIGYRRNSGLSDWGGKDRTVIKRESSSDHLDSGIASPASETSMDSGRKNDSAMDCLQPLDEILNGSVLPLLSDTEKTQDRGEDMELEIELDDVDWELFEQEVKVEPIILSDKDFVMAVESGDYDMVKRALLGDKKYDLESPDNMGKTLLMSAAEKVYDDIADLLIQHGADINAQDKLGVSALMLACEHAEICTVNLLLEYGAKVNQSQVAGETALMMASKRGHKQMLWLLLQHGANFSMETQTGLTALGLIKPLHFDDAESILTSHINRVKCEFDRQVSITLNNTAKIQTELFPLQCFPICDSQKFRVKFEHQHQPHSPGVGYLLFIAHAMFYNQDIKCRFYGPSAVTSVVLNGVQQSSLTEESNFVMSFCPLVPGRNEFVINTVSASDTKAKLLVQAYKAQLLQS